MTAERLADAPAAKHDFLCRQCRRWVVTTPGTWARAKCANRQCKLFGQQQTMYADRPATTQLHNNDS
jgi:hypothetical protein